MPPLPQQGQTPGLRKAPAFPPADGQRFRAYRTVRPSYLPPGQTRRESTQTHVPAGLYFAPPSCRVWRYLPNRPDRRGWSCPVFPVHTPLGKTPLSEGGCPSQWHPWHRRCLCQWWAVWRDPAASSIGQKAAHKTPCRPGTRSCLRDQRLIRTFACLQFGVLFFKRIGDVLQKIRPSTTCLYSAASMFFRSLSAAFHSFFSNGS